MSVDTSAGNILLLKGKMSEAKRTSICVPVSQKLKRQQMIRKK